MAGSNHEDANKSLVNSRWKAGSPVCIQCVYPDIKSEDAADDDDDDDNDNNKHRSIHHSWFAEEKYVYMCCLIL